MADRLISVLGLGFGDCGKGLFTDSLVRRYGAHTVVRFNGGAQAGHNVVLPDGRHHTFSQFGAGSFSKNVCTVLAHPVVVHPTALLEEARVLAAAGVDDAFDRLLIDPRCRVTTPYHQAAGRLREIARGAEAHGSCGAGFGATVSDALAHPDESLCWGDLARPDRVAARLEAIRCRVREEVESAWSERDCRRAESSGEWRIFDDDVVFLRWAEAASVAWRRVARGSTAAVLERMALPGTLVFEGAQGILLDERHGFDPHTTWSSTGTAAVESVAAEAGRPSEIVHLGVLRSYLTRHGNGPLPTEAAALDVLAEPHNGPAGWQGRFRRGHFDGVLLRYALAAVGRLDGLLVSHLDAFARAPGLLRWCTSYRVPKAPLADPADDVSDDRIRVRDAGVPERIVGLRTTPDGPSHGRALTQLLRRALPQYDASPPAGADAFLARLEAESGLRVRLASHGPTHAHVKRPSS